MRSLLLEKLFKDYQLELENNDSGSHGTCDWCIYSNDDIYVVVEKYQNHIEYEATVVLFENSEFEYTKPFKNGQENEMMKFITADKLLLKEQWALEQIKRDFV